MQNKSGGPAERRYVKIIADFRFALPPLVSRIARLFDTGVIMAGKGWAICCKGADYAARITMRLPIPSAYL
ncbi:MAG: hypothetical protein DRR06_20490 [Gammaproteobacteria bacterium]|nr:MAG: hypothetical protein DRR06_20490 [Gammaproteobacteria bacterium]